MSDIIKILMERDGMERADAEDLLRDARREVAQGSNPEEVLEDYFGLEPDYIFEVL